MGFALEHQVQGARQGQIAFAVAGLALHRHDLDVRVHHQLHGQVLINVAGRHLPDLVLVVDDFFARRTEEYGLALLVPHEGVGHRLLTFGHETGEIFRLGLERHRFLVDLARDAPQPRLELEDPVIGDQDRFFHSARLDLVQDEFIRQVGEGVGNGLGVEHLEGVRVFNQVFDHPGDDVPQLGVLLEFVELEQHVVGDENVVFVPVAQLHERLGILQEHIRVDDVILLLFHRGLTSACWEGSVSARAGGRLAENHNEEARTKSWIANPERSGESVEGESAKRRAGSDVQMTPRRTP